MEYAGVQVMRLAGLIVGGVKSRKDRRKLADSQAAHQIFVCVWLSFHSFFRGCESVAGTEQIRACTRANSARCIFGGCIASYMQTASCISMNAHSSHPGLEEFKILIQQVSLTRLKAELPAVILISFCYVEVQLDSDSINQ